MEQLERQESYLHRLHREHKERQARLYPNHQVEPPKPKSQPRFVLVTSKRVLPLPPLQMRPITFEGNAPMLMMLGLIAEYFRIETFQLLGHDRHWSLTHARQIACFVLRELKPRLSTVQLGRFMGGRDHATIINALRKTAGRCARSQNLKAKVFEVTCMCKQLKGPCE